MDLGTNYDNFLIQHVSSNRGYIWKLWIY